MKRGVSGWLVAILASACGTDGGGIDAPGAMTGGAGATSGTSSVAGTGAAGAASVSGASGAGGAAGATSGAGGAVGEGGSAGGGAGSAQAGGGGGANGSGLPKRVLLYHLSTLDIPSVPAQLTLLSTQLSSWGYEVEESVSPGDLSGESLAKFGAVGMINTCFEPFGKNATGEAEAAALKSFVEAGGGLFGTHCAAVTFQAVEPPHPYNGVIGGRGGHGFFEGKSACTTVEPHVTTQMLPASFDYTGNLDNADYLAPDTTVLVKCKWSGGDQKETAVSWLRTPGKGRVFYTNFAKEDADLKDATLGPKHALLGLAWVLGR